MKVYLVWFHDPGYMTSELIEVFLDGRRAGKYMREKNEEYDSTRAEGGIKSLVTAYTIEEREAK